MESGACAAASGGACASLDGHPDAISILLLGEGNLSFTYALVKRLSRSAAVRRATQQSDTVAGEHWRGCVVRITATTFDSADALPCKYPEAAVFLAYFATKRRVPVRYHGDVNATALSSAAAPLRGQPFHLLFFNNPHIGFEDLYRQRALLSHFFCSARELYLGGSPLPCPQEVVIALCDDQARRWDLLGCAARSGYVCVAAVPLRPADFPEYTNRRHQSDAAFPFHQMVHYYFVLSASVPHALLHNLVAEMHAWERERDARLAAGLPCSYTCVDWLRYARALLGDSAHAAAAVAPMDARDVAVGHLDAARCSDLSANTSSTGAPLQPVPLLHPALVANVVAGALGGSGGHAASPPTASLLTAATVGHAEVYTPYLPGSTWIALHRAQRAVEQQASACGDAAHSSSPEASEATAPPHLDAALLGRPLTSREAKKLERYLSGYGAAMKAKADLQRRRTSNAVGVWSCTECQPSRTFETAADLLQHQRSKHCGGVQLAPTLYARVHEQIEPSADNVATALADMNLEDDLYCAVCGLQFKDADAYAEHLRYLAPLPGEEEDVDLVCTACQPARTFTDRRALVQHVATKHPPPTAAVCHVWQLGDCSLAMALYRRMTLCDTMQFNFVNLDQLTETYNASFYGEYVTHWPEYQRLCVHPTTGIPMAYTLGKAEGHGEDLHGHVSAVSVAPAFRRVALGETLMRELAQMSEYVHNAYFVDLFVRKSNQVAQDMYHRLGYVVYRRVLQYYHGDGPKGPFKSDEDALDMRLALSRDKERRKSSVIPLDRPVKPEELEWR